MERYSEYKDSGVQWLGEIPSHWNIVKLKVYCKENKLKNKSNEETNVLSLSYGSIIDKKDLNSGLLPDNYSNYQIVSPGNIILRLTDLQNDHKSLRTGLVKKRGVITSAYVGLVINNINSEYTRLLLHTYDIQKVFYSMGGGLRQSMSYRDVENLPICVPPFAEQEKIVSYINDKTEKIDIFIAEKEKELQQLEELKQSEIANVVTKGLNPNVTMKDSGISWIGEIPRHWEVFRYGTLFKIKPFKDHKEDDDLLSVFLDRGVIKACESDKRTHNPSEDLSKYQLVEVGDFVMNNQQAWRGSVGVSKYRGIISPAYHIFTMPTKLLPEYANYMLRDRNMVCQFEMSSKGVGSIQRTLNFNWLNAAKVIVPTIKEQQAIVEYIDSRTNKINTLVSELQSEIEYLKEYKQSLISNAVTGQIKLC